MTRLTVVAAALAAGMTTFAAHSQESPVNFADAFANAPAKKDAKKSLEKGVEKQIAPRVSAAHEGEGMHHLPASVTVTETAESDGSAAPKLATTAGKEGKGTRKVIVLKDETEGRKKIVLKEETAGGRAVALAKSGGNGPYHAIVTRYASEYGVPASLAHAVIRIESNYRADARGRAGEVGLMQIKPATARGMGYSGSVKALYNPETNIRYGMKYLALAHQLGGGSTCGTILKYNAGHGARRMNPVSAAYCSKVKRHLAGS